MNFLKRIYSKTRTSFKKYSSTAFFLFLALSALLWYLVKLSEVYTTNFPVDVSIADTRITVKCVGEGVGYRIFALRNFPNKPIKLTLEEVNATRSPTNREYYIIDPLSLQNAISLRYDKLQILSIVPPPEIKPHIE